MSELLKGSRVKICTKSEFYGDPSNPSCNGTIESNDGLQDGWIGVDWDDGDWNKYKPKDLILINLQSK